MIRSLLVLCAALVSVNAFASPRIGDFALFDANITVNGQQYRGTVQLELAQFDPSRNQYLERQTVTIPGQNPQVTDTWKNASDFLDDSTIDSILANCSAAGGTPQTISVPAGSFNTCALNFDDADSRGTAWITKVPFGVARQDTMVKSNGMTINLNLRSYR